MELNLIQKIAIWALPVLFAITAHEAAHAYVARQFGDKTAWMLGRCSFNPLKHIEPFGTVLLPALCLMVGGFVFGWAKPVPVNAANLRDPKRDMLWVAAAGPGSNFVMAIFWAAIQAIGLRYGGAWAEPMALMGQAGIIINLSLMALNLLPLLPLDGGRMVAALLPRNLSNQFARIEPYGMSVLIGLLLLGQFANYPILSRLLEPIMMPAWRFILFLFN